MLLNQKTEKPESTDCVNRTALLQNFKAIKRNGLESESQDGKITLSWNSDGKNLFKPPSH